MNLSQVIMTGVLFIVSALRGTFNYIPDLSLFKHSASCFLLDIPYFALALDNIQTSLGQDLSATEHLRLACQVFNTNDSEDEILISVIGTLGNINNTQCPIDSAPIPIPITTPDLDGTPTLSAAPLSVVPLAQVSIMASPTPIPIPTPAVTLAPVPSVPVNMVNKNKTKAEGSTGNIHSPLPLDMLDTHPITLPDWVDKNLARNFLCLSMALFVCAVFLGFDGSTAEIPKSRSEIADELKCAREELEQLKLTKTIALIKITDTKVSATKVVLHEEKLPRKENKDLYQSLPQWLQDWLRVRKNRTVSPNLRLEYTPMPPTDPVPAMTPVQDLVNPAVNPSVAFMQHEVPTHYAWPHQLPVVPDVHSSLGLPTQPAGNLIEPAAEELAIPLAQPVVNIVDDDVDTVPTTTQTATDKSVDVSSEEDIPAQQEPPHAALVEILQPAAEPLVTENVSSSLQVEEMSQDEQPLPAPTAVESQDVNRPADNNTAVNLSDGPEETIQTCPSAMPELNSEKKTGSSNDQPGTILDDLNGGLNASIYAPQNILKATKVGLSTAQPISRASEQKIQSMTNLHTNSSGSSEARNPGPVFLLTTAGLRQSIWAPKTNHPSSTPASMDSPHDTDNNDTNDADDSAKVETERITLSAECHGPGVDQNPTVTAADEPQTPSSVTSELTAEDTDGPSQDGSKTLPPQGPHKNRRNRRRNNNRNNNPQPSHNQHRRRDGDSEGGPSSHNARGNGRGNNGGNGNGNSYNNGASSRRDGQSRGTGGTTGTQQQTDQTSHTAGRNGGWRSSQPGRNPDLGSDGPTWKGVGPPARDTPSDILFAHLRASGSKRKRK